MEKGFSPPEEVLWPVSVFSGIIMCKIVYEITGWISCLHFEGYNKLSKLQKIEWNNRQDLFIVFNLILTGYFSFGEFISQSLGNLLHNFLYRGFSTFHAIVAAAVSFYLLAVSETFNEGNSDDSVVNRKSALSDAMFGVSLGYFIADLGMILWLLPSLGGKEYILHHGLSMYSILLSLISGQGQIYILMVLFTEITTPFVNLRWYLDLAGQKSSMLYIYNGVALFLSWLVARIFLFIYFFIHVYLHFDQVKTIFPLGFYSLMAVPSMLAVMNALWFRKIFKGIVKTLSKKKHAH